MLRQLFICTTIAFATAIICDKVSTPDAVAAPKSATNNATLRSPIRWKYVDTSSGFNPGFSSPEDCSSRTFWLTNATESTFMASIVAETNASGTWVNVDPTNSPQHFYLKFLLSERITNSAGKVSWTRREDEMIGPHQAAYARAIFSHGWTVPDGTTWRVKLRVYEDLTGPEKALAAAGGYQNYLKIRSKHPSLSLNPLANNTHWWGKPVNCGQIDIIEK